MKRLEVTIILYLFLIAGAQGQTISNSVIPDSGIIELRQAIDSLKSENRYLRKELSGQKERLRMLSDSVKAKFDTVDAKTRHATSLLGDKIAQTEDSARTQIADVNKAVSQKTLFSIIGGVVLLLLSVVLFAWLYRRQKSNRADIIGQLEKTKSSIDERLVAEFAKSVEVLQSLSQNSGSLKGSEPDHSFALKVADEITLMERNISQMDADTRGLRQLTRSIGRLKDNLAAKDYEIPELLGSLYNEGMRAIIINTVPDENLGHGVELITKIVKPQVNYQDQMIQAAQIEVSVGV